jgi:cytidine deaminase
LDYGKLIDAALSARENAYVPYSHFKVGAAVLTEDGEIVSGCNVENASYGATNCAERTAIFTAVAMGKKKLKAIAVVGDLNSYTYPCGICRQVMVEFAENSDIPVIIAKNENEYMVKTLEEILPGAFTKDALSDAKEKQDV